MNKLGEKLNPHYQEVVRRISYENLNNFQNRSKRRKNKLVNNAPATFEFYDFSKLIKDNE